MKVDIANHDCTLQWGGTYYFALSDYPRISAWELQKLAQFARYEKAHGRRPRLKCRNLRLRRAAKAALRRPERVPAAEAPAKLTECTACKQGGCLTSWLCHTSSIDAAKSIFACGELRSAARARGLPGAALAKELRNGAGDPPDYFEYVMFSWGNCQAGDRLVVERDLAARLGRTPSREELDAALAHCFTPGVRFYFRYDDLAARPGCVFDGYHPAKIRDCLPLRECLAACIVPGNAWDEVSPLIPEELKARVHCLPYEGESIWDWADKCYQWMRNEVYTFRRAQARDIDSLVRLRTDFMEDYGPLSRESRAALGNYRDFLTEGMRDGTFVQWLAEIGGEIAATGSVNFYRLPPIAARPNGREAYIGNMFTYPPHRRRGLAARIVELLLEEARAAGCGIALLHATSDGRPVYEKAGFVPAEDMMKYHL